MWWKIFIELHKDKEFLKIMILPYLSLLVAIIALVSMWFKAVGQ